MATSSHELGGQAPLKSPGLAALGQAEDALPRSKGQRDLGTVPGEPEERMPRSPADCRGQATSSRDQGIRRVFQPSAATPGDWTEDTRGDHSPTSLAVARKAHRSSRPQWIAPRLQACYVSLQPSEQPRTGFSASTPSLLGKRRPVQGQRGYTKRGRPKM
jgi:hypothetical protein